MLIRSTPDHPVAGKTTSLSRLARQLATTAVAVTILAACSPASTGTDQATPTSRAGNQPGTTLAPTTSAGCGSASPVPPGTTDRALTSGGQTRQYQLIVPQSYDGTKALPIVFTLHPDVISNRVIPPMVGLPEMAAQYEFIGVSPSGLVNGTIPYWMAVRTDPPGHDVVFFADLLDQLERDLCVDPSRVYATGMANGSQMASLLACQLGDRITAVAPLAGPEWPEGCDGRPVPVMAFHGDKDPFVSYQDSRGDAFEIADRNFWKGNPPVGIPRHPGAEQAMANWAAHNGCQPDPRVDQISAEVVRLEWTGCQADTVFYHLVGSGHTWPGRPVPSFEATFGHTTMDIDATALMFKFFFDHHR